MVSENLKILLDEFDSEVHTLSEVAIILFVVELF